MFYVTLNSQFISQDLYKINVYASNHLYNPFCLILGVMWTHGLVINNKYMEELRKKTYFDLN